MSAEASTSAPLASESAARASSAAQRALDVADRAARAVGRGLWDAFEFSRFLIFAVFLAVNVVCFWLWLIAGALDVVRFLLRFVTIVLLTLSGGVTLPPDRPAGLAGFRYDLRSLWASRLVAYEGLARSLGRRIVFARRAGRAYWHWSIPRQLFALLVIVAFIGVPLTYLVPRPHYVQITDDNATHYEAEGEQVRYVIHALDLFDPDKTREYENEEAWWLGKINPQGLKSQLQIGRYYRIWVVGIRWYWKPTLFPNVIHATEVDKEGKDIEPSLLSTLPTGRPPGR